MATCTIEGLQTLLGRVGLDTPIPVYPGGDVVHNPQDIFRAYLADALHKVIDCDKLIAYQAIQPTNGIGAGDLVVISPKLRLDGIAPKELVVDLVRKVREEKVEPSGEPFARS